MPQVDVTSIVDEIEDSRTTPLPDQDLTPILKQVESVAIPPVEEMWTEGETSSAPQSVPSTSPGDFSTPSPVSGGMLDEDGEIWDKEIHQDPPQKTKAGKWMRKRGRKEGYQSTPIQTDPVSGQTITPAVDPNIQYRIAAEQTAGQIFLLTQSFIDREEWCPIVDPASGVDERKSMIEAWEGYYREYGVVKLPAWFTLCLVMGSFALPRFMLPRTKEKWEWIRSKVFGQKKTPREDGKITSDDLKVTKVEAKNGQSN